MFGSALSIVCSVQPLDVCFIFLPHHGTSRSLRHAAALSIKGSHSQMNIGFNIFDSMNANGSLSNSRTTRRSTRTKRQSHFQSKVSSINADEHQPPESLRDAASMDDTEVIDEDDLCPICQLLLHRPVTTFCNHTLCESCMATWANVSVDAQMQIVDVDEPDRPFNPVSGVEARCPMCRTLTSATLNSTRLREIKNRYPRTYTERDAEAAADKANGQEDEIQTLTLCIGNRHRLICPERNSSNMHEWVFFVRPSRTDIIEEVHMHLHSTFRPPMVIRSRPPYEVRRLGWGYFTVVAHVMLKPGYSWVSEDAEDSPDGAEKGRLALEWMLDFERFGGKGSMGRLRLKVKNQRDWINVSDEEEEDERERARLIRQYQADGEYVPDDEP